MTAGFELWLIGIGTGNPDHLTAQGAKAMRAADVILIPRKGDEKAGLAALRHQICAEVLGDGDGGPLLVEFDMPVRDGDTGYRAAVDDWHDRIALAWQAALEPHLPVGRVALLIWGDPSLYDSGLRIAARLKPQLACHVVPGITALQALTAAHAIPLNTIGEAVQITTGRKLREGGWPEGVDRVAVMLDAGGGFDAVDPTGIHIWWGAYLGMDQEVLVQGPLREVADTIKQTRASARTANGWIMDIYLMHRRPSQG